MTIEEDEKHVIDCVSILGKCFLEDKEVNEEEQQPRQDLPK